MSEQLPWSKNHCKDCGSLMRVGEHGAIGEDVEFFWCDTCENVKFEATESVWDIDWEKTEKEKLQEVTKK